MRLDLHSNEIARLLVVRGYTAAQPFDIEFRGETARVRLEHNNHVLISRTMQSRIIVESEIKTLEHLWVDERNPRP